MADGDHRTVRAADKARARHLVISVQRLLGAALIVLGLLALNGALDWGKTAGAVLVILGLVDFAVLPIVLARRWRTPSPTNHAE